MANAYSIQRNRQGWIDPTDQDFTLKALMFKQQKYDANQAKVQSVIEQYKSLQLARGVDQQYLQERLQALVNNINQYGPQDLSSNAVTQSIQYHIGQALDTNVMTAVQETAKIKNYQAEVDKIREKNPELYNTLNEAYGLAPAQEYLQNDQVGARIKGSLTYTPYKDIEGELQKTMLDIQTKAKDGVIEIPDNQGRIQKITTNGKSASELREIALGLMGDRYNQQFTINTWGKYGGFKNIQGASEQVSGYYDKLINANTQDIAEYKAQISGGKLSPADLEKAQAAVKQLENQRLLNQNNKNAFLKDPISGLIAMEKDNVASRIGSSLGLLQTKSTEYKKDEYWFSAQDLKLKIEEANWEKEKWNAEMGQKERFHQDDMAYKKDALAMKVYLDENGNPTSSKSGESGGGSSADGLDDIVANDLGTNTSGDNSKLESDNNQVVNMIQRERNAYNDIAKSAISKIDDIVSGRNKNVSPELKKDATDLVAHFKAKHGNINLKDFREPERIAFMKMVSRQDAYKNLRYLEVGGERSATGEMSEKGNIKTAWASKYNKYHVLNNGYSEARAAAQKEEIATGAKRRHFTENDKFKDFLKNTVHMLGNTQGFTSTLNKAGVSKINQLLMAKGITSPPPIEGGAFMFNKTSDGGMEVRFHVKNKDSEKNNVNEISQPIKLTRAEFDSYFPSVKDKVNLDNNQGVYSFRTIGTKPLTSPNATYLNPHDVNYKADEADARKILSSMGREASNNLVYLTKDGTNRMLQISMNGIPDETKPLANRIARVISDPNTVGKYKVQTQYAHSYDGSGKADLVVTLVDNYGNKIISSNLGKQQYADNYVDLFESYPQIAVNMLLGKEFHESMNNFRQRNGQVTEGLETILKRENFGAN